MSIKPLDLQTLFIKMGEVGKDEAHKQKAVENQQDREAKEIIKKENDRDKKVNKTEEDKESNKVVVDSEKGGRNNETHYKKKEESKEEAKAKKYFTDPDMGHNIDITG